MTRAWRLVLVTAMTGALLIVAAPASAQDGTPTPGAGQNVTTRTVPITGADDYLWFTGFVLIFAAAALIAFLVYVYRIQDHFYATTASLIRVGHVPRVTSVPSLPHSRAVGQLEVSGPLIVAVGIESEAFEVRSGGNLVTEADWSVEPPDAATWKIAGTVGTGRITITAARAGALTLTASDKSQAGGGQSSAPFQVVAVPPSGKQVDLPFVGQDFGTVLIAIILVAAVIVLAIGGILGAEAVATFFGGLLGYIFGVARRDEGSGANGDNGASPP